MQSSRIGTVGRCWNSTEAHLGKNCEENCMGNAFSDVWLRKVNLLGKHLVCAVWGLSTAVLSSLLDLFDCRLIESIAAEHCKVEFP